VLVDAVSVLSDAILVLCDAILVLCVSKEVWGISSEHRKWHKAVCYCVMLYDAVSCCVILYVGKEKRTRSSAGGLTSCCCVLCNAILVLCDAP
jgi:hypothetical protein